MRSFAITSKGNQESNDLMDSLKHRLITLGLEYNEDRPDIVISIGGDGTLLYAFHRYKRRLSKTAFVGMHTGHLGFYADWLPKDMEKLVEAIASKKYEIVEYPLLEVDVYYTNGDLLKSEYIALNECTVRSLEGTLVMNIEIRGDIFETFRGDGLCISTPTGSTAYNKALGGAILHPSLEVIQLTEMASINNRVFRTIGSPLILPNNHRCVLMPINSNDLRITIDHLTLLEKDVESIECRVSSEKIRFARYRRVPFWNRVRDSFISDLRNE